MDGCPTPHLRLCFPYYRLIQDWRGRFGLILEGDRYLSSLTFCHSPFGLSQNITDRVAYKQQKFVSHSTKDWKSKITGTAWSGESSLWASQLLTFTVSSHGGRDQRSLWILFYKAPPVTTLGPPQRVTSCYHHLWGIGFQCVNFWGTQTFRSQYLLFLVSLFTTLGPPRLKRYPSRPVPFPFCPLRGIGLIKYSVGLQRQEARQEVIEG